MVARLLGCSGLVLALASACSAASPTIDQVVPPVVTNLVSARVALTGNLTGSPTVDLDDDDVPPMIDSQFEVTVGGEPIADTELVEPNRLEIVIPAGFPLGVHDVVVTTPRGDTVRVDDALTVVDTVVRPCSDFLDCVDPCRSDVACDGLVCQLGPVDLPLCTGFGPAAVIAELSDASAVDRSPSVTADLREIYFASDRGGDFDIFVATRSSSSDPWSPPTRVDELSSARDDTAVGVAADGLSIYIASHRDSPPQRDIYVSVRSARDGAWSTPTRVDELSSAEIDDAPAIDGSGLIAVLRRGLADGDLFVSRRLLRTDPFGEPEPLVEINTRADEVSGQPAPGALVLYFSGERAGGAGGLDLWVSARNNAGNLLSTPEPLGDLSGPTDDRDPWVAADGSYVVFASDRTGTFDLFESR